MRRGAEGPQAGVRPARGAAGAGRGVRRAACGQSNMSRLYYYGCRKRSARELAALPPCVKQAARGTPRTAMSASAMLCPGLELEPP
jgi:hypothetical protein